VKRLIFLFLIFASLPYAIAQDKPKAAPITKEAIQARIRDLQKTKEQLTADLNAVLGAIQDSQFYLDQIEANEKAEKAKAEKAKDASRKGQLSKGDQP
jgi:hypothetical protein